MYYHGKGCRQDFAIAKEMYEKACNLGFGEGCYNLGVMHKNGDGIRKDIYAAKDLYSKACKLGYETGCKQYIGLGVKGF